MHSLAESCRLCSVNIADYFTDLFRHARSTLSSDDLRGLLPNHYCAKCYKHFVGKNFFNDTKY